MSLFALLTASLALAIIATAGAAPQEVNYGFWDVKGKQQAEVDSGQLGQDSNGKQGANAVAGNYASVYAQDGYSEDPYGPGGNGARAYNYDDNGSATRHSNTNAQQWAEGGDGYNGDEYNAEGYAGEAYSEASIEGYFGGDASQGDAYTGAGAPGYGGDRSENAYWDGPNEAEGGYGDQQPQAGGDYGGGEWIGRCKGEEVFIPNEVKFNSTANCACMSRQPLKINEPQICLTRAIQGCPEHGSYQTGGICSVWCEEPEDNAKVTWLYNGWISGTGGQTICVADFMPGVVGLQGTCTITAIAHCCEPAGPSVYTASAAPTIKAARTKARAKYWSVITSTVPPKYKAVLDKLQ